MRYPIGRYIQEEEITRELLEQWLDRIASFPARLRQAVSGLSELQLDTAYRPDGWTVRQVVHHLADSHMNSYIRFKLALTEQNPVIKPYFEDRWAELPDGKAAPIELSLSLLDSLHDRWSILLRSLDAEQLTRCFVHPETGRTIRLDWNIGLYAWHGDHHLAQITQLCKRMCW